MPVLKMVDAVGPWRGLNPLCAPELAGEMECWFLLGWRPFRGEGDPTPFEER